MRGATPGWYRTTRKTVPPSTVVLNGAFVGSSKPSLLTGNPFVAHITDDDAPARFEITLSTFSSISTLARPSALCPVTTRRILKVIPFSFQARPCLFLPSAKTRQRSPSCETLHHAIPCGSIHSTNHHLNAVRQHYRAAHCPKSVKRLFLQSRVCG